MAREVVGKPGSEVTLKPRAESVPRRNKWPSLPNAAIVK